MPNVQDPNILGLLEQIEAEMERLGLDGETYGSSAPAVDLSSDLPFGWIAILENDYYYVGLAIDFRNTLAAIPTPPVRTEEDTDHPGLVAMFAAFDDCQNNLRDLWPAKELSPADWLASHDFAGLDWKNGFDLVVVRTNGGFKYGFAPSAPDYLAFNSILDYSPLHDTAGAARDECFAFVASRAAELATDNLNLP